MKKFLILFLFAGSLYAQRGAILPSPTAVTIQSKTIAAQDTSSTAGTDSVYILTNGGFMSVRIDSAKSDADSLATLRDSTVAYGDTLWLIFNYDRSTSGDHTNYWYVWHSGYDKKDTSTIQYSIDTGYVPISSSNWVTSDMGGLGWQTDIRVDPVDSNKVYKVSDLGGFYYSTDQGGTWVGSNDGVYSYEGSQLAVKSDGSTIYYANNSGIYKSVNAGKSWSRLGEGILYPAPTYSTSNGTQFSAVYIHPANESIIYAGNGGSHDVDRGGTDPEHCWKSTDGGTSWTNITGTIDTVSNAYGNFSGSHTNANLIYTSTRKGLYKSTNGGSTWSQLKTSNIKWVEVNPTNDQDVYYAENFSGGKLYHSTNGGSSWTDVTPTGLTEPSEIRYTSDGANVFVGDALGTTDIYYSTNNGNSWSEYVRAILGINWYRSEPTVRCFDVSPSGIYLYYGDDLGLYATFNGGASTVNLSQSSVATNYWHSNGASVGVIRDIAINPSNKNTILLAIADFTYLISHDGGYSWKWDRTLLDAGWHEGQSIAFNPTDTTIVYMTVGATVKEDSTSLWKSSDGGSTWTKLTTNLPTGVWKNITFNSSGKIFVNAYYPGTGFSKALYSSTNGTTWTWEFDGYYNTDIQIAPSNENIMYVSSAYWDKSIWKSTDAGVTWTGITNTNLAQVTSVAIDPLYPDVVYCSQNGWAIGGSNSDPAGIYKSTDGGSTWTKILSPDSSADPGTFSQVRVDPTNHLRVIAFSNKRGEKYDDAVGDSIKISEDGGSTWSSLENNLWTNNVTIAKFNSSGELFIGSGGTGTYKLSNVSGIVTPPTITSTSESWSGADLTVTVNFTSNGTNNTAYSNIGLDTLNWYVNMDAMTITGSYVGTYTYNGLDKTATYYVKTLVQNEAGKDTSNADTVSFSSLVAGIDTLYSATNTDDVYRIYSTNLYDFNYLNIGSQSGNTIKDGIRFTGVNNYAQIDSAKIEFTGNGGIPADTINCNIYGENTASPATFSTYSDFDTRVGNLTTNYSTAMNNLTGINWSLGGTHQIDVTAVIQELNSSYTYSNGALVLFIIDSSSPQYISVKSYNNGTGKPKLIIWYKN